MGFRAFVGLATGSLSMSNRNTLCCTTFVRVPLNSSMFLGLFDRVLSIATRLQHPNDSLREYDVKI